MDNPAAAPPAQQKVLNPRPPPPPTISANDLDPALAVELAIGLLPIADILTRFGISKAHLVALLKNAVFRGMVTDYKREWHAASNAKERVKLKAAMAAEEGLLQLYGIFNNADVNPTARLEAYKQLTNLADVVPKKDAVETGSRFNLTLNLGGDPTVTHTPGITIDATPTQSVLKPGE